MSALNQTIRELQVRRNRAERELDKLSLAIKALEQLNGGIAVLGQSKRKSKMSVAGRARIVAAQKARWAKIRAQKKK